MVIKQLVLNDRQSGTFDKFLMDGTHKVQRAIESMYELDIVQSSACIEIAPLDECLALRNIGHGSLYTISSNLLGEVKGDIHLLLRSTDFDCLADLLKPVLSILFLSDPDIDLRTLDSRKPVWMEEPGQSDLSDANFFEQLKDTMTEMGNVLIGLYTKAIFNKFALAAHHSLPRVKLPNPESLYEILNPLAMSNGLVLAIENEFHFASGTVCLWCVISLAEGTFEELLKRIESADGCQNESSVPKLAVPVH